MSFAPHPTIDRSRQASETAQPVGPEIRRGRPHYGSGKSRGPLMLPINAINKQWHGSSLLLAISIFGRLPDE
ncbi:hypothetical protein OUZ56_005450 [Daphnia magna]|uniref:Uncharacterized protein n=1 Tax=Daphnia magna TaxID=35525 RepID=A0ABQ9YSV3_9CRUS|nr:hypothetical protein OUZ56_005450 [Daphnia magna]